MVGLDAAGKTTILYKLKLGEGTFFGDMALFRRCSANDSSSVKLPRRNVTLSTKVFVICRTALFAPPQLLPPSPPLVSYGRHHFWTVASADIWKDNSRVGFACTVGDPYTSMSLSNQQLYGFRLSPRA